MAFIGMLPMEYECPVLVAEDTIYPRERIDHAQRLMMFGRPQVAGQAQNLIRMALPRPPPTLFEDRFVGVIPVVEAYSQYGPNPPTRQLWFAYLPSTRLDEPNPEDYTRRLDHSLIRAFRSSQNVAFFLPYTFEIPDLCDNPWLEWVHPANDPAPAMLMLRPDTSPGSQYQPSLVFYQQPRLRVEAEEDAGIHVHADASYFALTRQIAAPAPPTPGPWVMAVTEGYYLGVLRPKGDIFKLVNINDLADASVNYDAALDNLPQQLPGWMQVLPGTPAQLQQVQSLVVPGSNEPTPPVSAQVAPPRTVY